MRKRRRFKQTKPLEVRLAEEAARLREQAQLLPRGRLRDQVENAVDSFRRVILGQTRVVCELLNQIILVQGTAPFRDSLPARES